MTHHHERAGFAEPRERTRDVQGHVLTVGKDRRPILVRRSSGLATDRSDRALTDLTRE
jgi:hypothetical protein